MERTKILDTSVAIEQKEGLVTAITVVEYPKSLDKKFDIVWLQTEDYRKAIEISAKLYKIGKPIPASDILIAAVAIRLNAILLTLDKHFKVIGEVDSSFTYQLFKK